MPQEQQFLNSPTTRINKVFSQFKKIKSKRYIYIYIYIYIYANENYSKETLEIRKETWKTVKRLRSQGTYEYLVYDRIATKGKFRMQQNE